MIVMPFMIDSNISGTDFSRDANNPDFGRVSPNFMANLIHVYSIFSKSGIIFILSFRSGVYLINKTCKNSESKNIIMADNFPLLKKRILSILR
jgi:hypothetical protein